VLQAIVRLAVLAILLISAAAVTKLMAINISSTRNIVWSQITMKENIEYAMQVSLLVAPPCLHMFVASGILCIRYRLPADMQHALSLVPHFEAAMFCKPRKYVAAV
jgi:hypothetical protein